MIDHENCENCDNHMCPKKNGSTIIGFSVNNYSTQTIKVEEFDGSLFEYYLLMWGEAVFTSHNSVLPLSR